MVEKKESSIVLSIFRTAVARDENDSNPTCTRSWFGTIQHHWNHQVKSDWPLFGGTFILNLDNTVN